MYYILRHGFKKPTDKNLLDYQLGWSTEDQCLYICDPNKENKIQRVINDEVIQDFISSYINNIDTSAKQYFKSIMVDTKKTLRNTYEKNIVYTVSYNYKSDGSNKIPGDAAGKDYYSTNNRDKAIEKFINDYNDDELDLEGAKVILTDNNTKNVYFYIIIRNEENKLFGKFLTVLETSLPNLSMTYDNKSNSILFKVGNELINQVSLANLKLDCGSWD